MKVKNLILQAIYSIPKLDLIEQIYAKKYKEDLEEGKI